MIALAFGILFMPVCATIAGLALWVVSRDEELEDGALFRHFLLILAICAVSLWGASRTDAMRMRLDPQFRIQTELDAHPVYAAIKRLAPDDHKKLHDFLALRLSQGDTVPQAMLQARPLLTALTNHRLGFADRKAKVRWGQVTLDTLRELRAADPILCYRALSPEPLDRQTLAQGFSPENAKAFQEAVIEVYEAADRGMRHQRAPDEKPLEFNEVALEYRVIKNGIVARFGEPAARQIAARDFPQPPVEPAERMCAARIAQLEAVLERPPAMASRLIDNALR